MKWGFIISIVSATIGVVTYSFTTFATISWTKDYVDTRHQQVKEDLAEIKQDLKDVKGILLKKEK